MTVPKTNTDVFNAGREETVATMALAYIDDRGAVFTKSCVVNFILDLFGYWKLGAKSVIRILLLPPPQRRVPRQIFPNSKGIMLALVRIVQSYS